MDNLARFHIATQDNTGGRRIDNQLIELKIDQIQPGLCLGNRILGLLEFCMGLSDSDLCLGDRGSSLVWSGVDNSLTVNNITII